MKGLYDDKNPLAFGIAGTLLLFVVVPLLPMSLMGLFLIVPGILGLIGLWGLVNAWYGLDAPHYVRRANEGILFRLCCGLGAAAYGLLHVLENKPKSIVEWVFAGAVGLYSAMAIFFLFALTFNAQKAGRKYLFELSPPIGACVWVSVVVGATLCWSPGGVSPLYSSLYVAIASVLSPGGWR